MYLYSDEYFNWCFMKYLQVRKICNNDMVTDTKVNKT